MFKLKFVGLFFVLSVLGSPLVFTHSFGYMFNTDLKNDRFALRSSREVPQVHCISQDPLHYSMVSAEAAKKIKTLESLIGIDPGKNKQKKSYFDRLVMR